MVVTATNPPAREDYNKAQQTATIDDQSNDQGTITLTYQHISACFSFQGTLKGQLHNKIGLFCIELSLNEAGKET